jgi:hypothetical protein
MKYRLVIAALLLGATICAAADRIDVGRFSQNDMSGWDKQIFSKETDYQLASEAPGVVLRAESEGAGSGLVRRIEIDLEKTPYLHWSWKAGNILHGNDEHSRAGDDYPVRIYVVFSGGLFFWRTRAINYVWSSHQPVGTQWPNAFTSQTRMIAVDSGSEMLGQWISHSRNIREDYRQLFGEEIRAADAVAIMSDTDNTGQKATAWYGDIWFAAQ